MDDLRKLMSKIMGGQKKGLFDPFLGILELLRCGPCTKITLDGKINSDKSLTEYIRMTRTLNLVAFDFEVYKITGKGLEFLEEYEKLKLNISNASAS